VQLNCKNTAQKALKIATSDAKSNFFLGRGHFSLPNPSWGGDTLLHTSLPLAPIAPQLSRLRRSTLAPRPNCQYLFPVILGPALTLHWTTHLEKCKKVILAIGNISVPVFWNTRHVTHKANYHNYKGSRACHHRADYSCRISNEWQFRVIHSPNEPVVIFRKPYKIEKWLLSSSLNIRSRIVPYMQFCMTADAHVL